MARSPDLLPLITSSCPAGPRPRPCPSPPTSDPTALYPAGGGLNRLEAAASSPRKEPGSAQLWGQGPPRELHDLTVTYRAGSAITSSLASWGGEVKGQKAKREGQTRACKYGVGLGPWLLGGSQATGRRRAGRGRGRGRGGRSWPVAPKTGEAGPGRGTWGASRGRLTQQWELAGAQMPSPGEGRRCQGHAEAGSPKEANGGGGGMSGQLRLEQRWPQGPRPQQLRERPPEPALRPQSPGRASARSCQRVTGAGLEFASGRCRR